MSDHQKPNRVGRRRQATQQALHHAVIDLLAANDLPLTSRTVAEAADVAIGTFYNHFESIEAAIDSAFVPLRERALTVMDQLVESDDPATAMGSALASLIHNLQTDPSQWIAARRAGYELRVAGRGRLARRFADDGVGVDPDDDEAVDAAGELASRMVSSIIDEVFEHGRRAALPGHLGRMVGAALITDAAALDRLANALEQEYRQLPDAG